MTGKTLTLTLPAPLAHELGSATQDFLAESPGARAARGSKWSARSIATRAAGCRSARRPTGRRVAGDLARYAYARGMEPPFSAQTLAEELGSAPRPDRLDPPADGAGSCPALPLPHRPAGTISASASVQTQRPSSLCAAPSGC